MSWKVNAPAALTLHLDTGRRSRKWNAHNANEKKASFLCISHGWNGPKVVVTRRENTSEWLLLLQICTISYCRHTDRHYVDRLCVWRMAGGKRKEVRSGQWENGHSCRWKDAFVVDCSGKGYRKKKKKWRSTQTDWPVPGRRGKKGSSFSVAYSSWTLSAEPSNQFSPCSEFSPAVFGVCLWLGGAHSGHNVSSLSSSELRSTSLPEC